MKNERFSKQLLMLAGSICLLFSLCSPVQAAGTQQPPAPAGTPSPCTQEQAFELPGGSLGLVCKPSDGWNGDVIVYAHGYVDPTETERVFANLDAGSGLSLPAIVQQLGYAFAATTYRRNGLVVLEGVQDLRELVESLPTHLQTAPRQVFAFGISEGGLIATLFAERSPLSINGTLAACGPIGDFKLQITYFGNFRTLFDFYFPGVLPGDATTIPPEVIANWDSVYVPKITQELGNKKDVAAKLIADSGAAIDPAAVDSSTLQTTLGLLRYNVFSTNDAKARLGGNPYDSAGLRATFPTYNLKLYTADAAATKALEAYQTTGRTAVPVITTHTTRDEIVPIWHQQLYAAKAENNGFASSRTFERYGHCAFQPNEVLSSFIALAQRGAQLRRVYLPLP